MKILIINGVNLNNIGIRETNIYGKEDFFSYLDKIKYQFTCQIDYFQSNNESEIVEKIHKARGENYIGIVLNAGAFSHTSVAIRDAIVATETKVVLVHISNTYKREFFRQQEIIAPVCCCIITGFGLNSYKLGVVSLLDI